MMVPFLISSPFFFLSVFPSFFRSVSSVKHYNVDGMQSRESAGLPCCLIRFPLLGSYFFSFPSDFLPPAFFSLLAVSSVNRTLRCGVLTRNYPTCSEQPTSLDCPYELFSKSFPPRPFLSRESLAFLGAYSSGPRTSIFLGCRSTTPIPSFFLLTLLFFF